MYPKACFIPHTGANTKANTAQNNEDELYRLIESYPLATMLLPVNSEEFPHTSHLPFYLDSPNRQLLAHCSNQHPLAQQLLNNDLVDNTKVMLIFNGENNYISPNYSTELIVPTWNYSAVHLQGQVQLITDYEEKLQIMTKTTAHFETLQNTPWQLSALKEKQLTSMFNAITTFKTNIEDITGVFKLSQNKSASCQADIQAALKFQSSKLTD